jgi:hypothetical protein
VENPGKSTKKQSQRKAWKVQGIGGVSRRMLPQQNSETFRALAEGCTKMAFTGITEKLVYSPRLSYITTGIDGDQGSSERTTGFCGESYDDW